MNAVTEENPSTADLSSSEDSFEELKELESQLYSVIHYNDLSETIPVNLPEGYVIDVNKSNEVVVSLKTDVIHSNDDHSLNNSEEICNLVVGNTSKDLDESPSSNSEEISSNLNNISSNKSSSESPADVSDEACIVSDSTDDDIMIIDCSFPISNKNLTTNKCSVVSDSVIKSNENNKNISAAYDRLQSSISSNSDVLVNHEKVYENDIITNISLDRNKKIEAIVISSDEDTRKEISCSSSEKIRTKKKKKKKIDKQYPKKWNPSMIKFYSKISRKKLNFDSGKLIRQMRETVGPEGWFLNYKDLYGSPSARLKKRCPRCRQYDHDIRNCPEAIKPVVCFMCGITGHRHNQCPQRKCLKCGKPNSTFCKVCNNCSMETRKSKCVCSICNSRSHLASLCPDVWRGFHMTTKEDSLVIPIKCDNYKKVCCNCAKHGHLDFECSQFRNAPNMKENPSVSNYLNVAEVFASQIKSLNVNIRLTSSEGNLLGSDAGCNFLQDLSNTTEAQLELDIESQNKTLTVIGSKSQCKAVEESLSNFLEIQSASTSFHKHKRKSPSKKRKIS